VPAVWSAAFAMKSPVIVLVLLLVIDLAAVG
jgi:hypothetical protein